MVSQAAYPSLLNFQGFPKCISTSVNNVAAHGVPDSRRLQEGDILNIDVTVSGKKHIRNSVNHHLGESVTQKQRWKIGNFQNFIFCHLNIVRV